MLERIGVKMLLLRNVAANCTDRRFVHLKERCTIVSLKVILNEHPDIRIPIDGDAENSHQEGCHRKPLAFRLQFKAYNVTSTDVPKSIEVDA